MRTLTTMLAVLLVGALFGWGFSTFQMQESLARYDRYVSSCQEEKDALLAQCPGPAHWDNSGNEITVDGVSAGANILNAGEDANVLLEIEPGGVISVSPDSENSLKVLGDGDVEFSRAGTDTWPDTGDDLELPTFDEATPGAQERPDPTDLGAASTDWETTIDWSPQVYLTISPAREFIIYDDDGSVLVSINPSQHTAFFGKRYSPEGAARAFWDAVAAWTPCGAPCAIDNEEVIGK
jgi:hypothetical protein